MKIEQNLIDRAIAAFSPGWAVQRLRARATMAMASGWLGGSTNRRQTAAWTDAGGADADQTNIGDLSKLRERSRDLIRNAPIAAGAYNTMTQNVIGTGLALQSRPDAKTLGMTEDQAQEFASTVQREFSFWADSNECDVTRSHNFYGLQNLAFGAKFEGGDAFALMRRIPGPMSPYGLKIQLLEADRVDNPPGVLDGGKLPSGNTCVGGVELDANGAPVAYHVRKFHPGSMQGRGNREADRIEAFSKETGFRNVLHLLERRRIGQNRGVPDLAPVIESLKQLDQFREAELMAAVVAACFTVFVHSPTGEGLANGLTSTVSGGLSTDDALAGQSKSGEQVMMAPGAILDMPDGREIKFANPNRPNTTFDLFVQAVAQQIGPAIGLPYEVLMQRFQASYSAARAAFLQAWKTYINRRTWLAQVFCQPIFEIWMYEAVAIGRINAPGYLSDPWLRAAYQRAEWIGDAPGSIDPNKEVQAAKERISLCLTTREEETMALTGTSWADKFPQMKKEHDMLEEAGLLPVDAAAAVEPPEDSGGNDTEGGGDEDKPQPPKVENHIHVAAPQITVNTPDINVTTPDVSVHPTFEVKQAPIDLRVHLEQPTPGKKTVTLVNGPDGQPIGAEVVEEKRSEIRIGGND
jgi:lambda family phage portal protein